MKSLLFIAHRLPYPPDKGERIRAMEEIKALSGKFRITLAALAHDSRELDLAGKLNAWCERIIVDRVRPRLAKCRAAAAAFRGQCATTTFFHSRQLHRRVLEIAQRDPFDVVLAYSSSTLPYALTIPAPVRVADLVDADSAKWAQYAQRGGMLRRIYAREALAVARLEQQAVQNCQAVLLVSRAEAGNLSGGDNIQVIGNGVDVEYFSALPDKGADGNSLVFTGTMNYPPNVDAMCWFAREVWPGLHRLIPDAKLNIVGRDPAAQVRRLSRMPGIHVTGTVADVRPYIAAAAIAIAPLRIARGIQNKVLEAMAMGKAVVASGPALEGLEVEVGHDILRADSPGQWRSSLARLLSNANLRKQLGKSARACMEASYGWSQRMRPLVTLCEHLCDRAASARAAVAACGEAR